MPSLLEPLRKARRYARLFSWRQMVAFKVTDRVIGWVENRWFRRMRALRLFAWTVPLDDLVLRDGAYRFHYPVEGRRVELALRTGSSDVDVFMQVIVDEEYGQVAQMLPEGPGPLRIIDAGANIGLTTLYLKCAHPDAHVVALEPESGNFEELSRCVARNALENVTPLHEGLWVEDGHLVEDRGFRDGRDWSFALREAAGATGTPVPVTSLRTLLTRMRWEVADLLKVDIEGGEAALIRDPAFLETVRDRVRTLCMEVHEEVVTVAEVRSALASVGLKAVHGGETLVAWNPALDAGMDGG